MRTAIIVQARMTSTRLPGKVLKEVLGRPLLQYQMERLQRVAFADDVVIATTANGTDQPIIDFCKALDITYYRGSEDDVLERYFEAAESARADLVVRVTSDCPLIDPAVIDRVLKVYARAGGAVDYVSNTLTRTYPRGMDCEVFPFRVLEQAHRQATEPVEREHVTPYVYRHPDKFRMMNVICDEDLSGHRWTVDTAEDFELISRMIEYLYPRKSEFSFQDCLDALSDNADWIYLNQHIEQKVH